MTEDIGRRRAYTLLAFVAAGLLPAVLMSFSASAGEGLELFGFVMWGIFFAFFSLLATLLLGVPAFLILRWFDLIRWWSATLAGAGVGALVGWCFPPGNLGSATFFAALGALSGIVFWFVRRFGLAPR